MTAALLFQLTSLLVSIAMVPLLLGSLGAAEYLVWAIFTTIGGLTLQLESAIQTLMVRRVAPFAAQRDFAAILLELARARQAYRLLSLGVLLIMLPCGWIYLSLAVFGNDGSRAPQGWALAWLAFGLAYGINYLFGPNNVVLLSTRRTDAYFRIGTVSRIVNLLLTLGALKAGFGLPGIAASFLISVLLNVGGIAAAARRGGFATAAALPAPATAGRPEDDAGLWRYTAFTLSAFLLYRGAFLLAVSAFATELSASYGLALQAFAILGSVAIIPASVRLHQMVGAIARGDTARQDRELVRSMAFAVLAIGSGCATLALAGPSLLELIGSDVVLPARGLLVLMAAAFLVEALILILTNPLLLQRSLGFVRGYVTVASLALCAGAFALAMDAPLGVALILLPLAIQATLSLPMMFLHLARVRGVSPGRLLAGLWTCVPAAAGREQ